MSRIRLIVVDAGQTAGTFGGPTTEELLDSVSPLGMERCKEESRRLLHTEPEPTEEVLARLCGALLIRPQDLPTNWDESTFTAYPYAAEAITEMVDATAAPIAVLSNIPCTTGPARMRMLAEQLPMVERIYTSYKFGVRKPDPIVWRWIAEDFGVGLDECVHIGDQWKNDVLGAEFAGCRAIYVNTRGYVPPPEKEWPAGRDRIAVANDLRGAAAVVRCWQQEAA